VKTLLQWMGLWPVVDHEGHDHLHSKRANQACEQYVAYQVDVRIDHFLACSTV
jgi:hypothetical protein